MINKLLVAAAAQSIEDILIRENIPYKFRDDAEYRLFQKMWDESDTKEGSLAYRQARPAIDRIFSKEPYIFLTDGEPLCIRFNFLERELSKDSFGEIMLERADLNWRISISIKNNANVLSSLVVADRDAAVYKDDVVNVFNEIDDFGDRIFSVPCSNEYFEEINSILQKIEPLDKETWDRLTTDEKFANNNLIYPMLEALRAEFPRIFEFHPEAPEKLLDYFYGKIDYYFFYPVEELKVTRIGAVNAHGDLGRIPDNNNFNTQPVRFPTRLLEVRFASGPFREISKDTLRLTFDGGWTLCIKVNIDENAENGHYFALNVFMPTTPFGSYRDQVDWLPEA